MRDTVMSEYTIKGLPISTTDGILNNYCTMHNENHEGRLWKVTRQQCIVHRGQG